MSSQEAVEGSSPTSELVEKTQKLSVNEDLNKESGDAVTATATTTSTTTDQNNNPTTNPTPSPKPSTPSQPKQENPPSKVVHLRNLPLPASNHHFQNPGSHYNQANANVENEIIEAAFKYGHVMDILLMRKSGQAFLQMEDLEAGKKFVEAHREKPLNIGTHSVYVQYSKHSELTNIDDNQHQQKIRKTLEDARNGIFRDFRTNYNKPFNNNNNNSNRAGSNNNNNNNNAATSHRSNSSNNWAQENDPHTNAHDNRAAGDNNQSANNQVQNHNNNDTKNNEKRILHVVIEKEDTQNPVKIHDYYDTFSKHGNVQKIVMFKKTGPTNTQQVLIEMDTQIACATAYNEFNGKNLRSNNQKNPHTMRIDYSTLAELTVKADGETRWDYTRTKRPTAEQENSHHAHGFNANHAMMVGAHHQQFMAGNMMLGHNFHAGNAFMAPQFLNNHNMQQQSSVFGSNNNLSSNNSNNNNNNSNNNNNRSGSANSNSNSQNNNNNNNNSSSNSKLGNSINAQPWIPNNNNNNSSNANNNNNNGANSGNNSQAGGDNKMNQLPHMFNGFQPNGFQSYLHPMMMSNLVNNHPNLQHMQYAYAYADPSKMPQMPFQGPGQLSQNQFDPRLNMMMPQMPYIQNNVGSCVVCVSNLNTELVKPDDLFTLFGTHGDVVRVKILYEKRDTALIEFQLQMQAEQALRNLNNKKLFGKEMKLKLSKFPKVNMPKEGADTYNLTKEYLNSPLHRYRKTGSKNYQNIYEPSNVLHLSNIPDGKTEEDIVNIFSKHAAVQKFKFFKDTKMALIQVGSIDDAIHCLIKTHNHRMSANQHLRVSFSKGFLS